METMQIVDWTATLTLFALAALQGAAFWCARKLQERTPGTSGFNRMALLPGSSALGFIAYGGWSIVNDYMAMPGGSAYTGPMAYAAGAVLIVAGFSLEAMVVASARRGNEGTRSMILHPSL